jgi:hypothetical protein
MFQSDFGDCEVKLDISRSDLKSGSADLANLNQKQAANTNK